MDNRQEVRLFLLFFLGAGLLLAALFWAYVSAIVLATLLGCVFYRPYTWLRGRLRGREKTAAALFTLSILLVVIVPAILVLSSLFHEAMRFYRDTAGGLSISGITHTLETTPLLRDTLHALRAHVGLEITPERVAEAALSLGREVGFFLYNQLSSMASNLVHLLLQLFIMTLMLFCLFKDGQRLKDYVLDLLPVPREHMLLLGTKLAEVARALFVGNLFSGLIQGVFGGVGFALFGLGAPLLWGSLTAFFALLPVVGASAVYIPGTIVLFVQGKTTLAIGFFLYNSVYAGVVDYLLKPRLIGRGMQSHALFVFIGCLGGITLFGVMGIVYGPLIITLFLTLAEIYRLEYKERVPGAEPKESAAPPGAPGGLAAGGG